MGIFQRIGNLLKGYANSAVESLEDPKVVVEQAIRDLEVVKKETTDAVAQCMAEEKRIKAMLDETNKKVELWHTRATNALKSNNESDAREALEQRNNYKAQAERLQETLNEQAAQVKLLKDSLDEISERTEEAKRRKENILAQAKVNDANENVNRVLTKTAKNNLFEELDRMEEKVNSKKYKIDSLRDLEEEISKDNKFDKYDNFSSSVDEDLAALKKELENN